MHTLSEATLTVEKDTVAQGLAWLETTGQDAGWPPRTRFKLRLCLDETLTNVTMYGFTDRAASDTAATHRATPRIRLRAAQEGSRIELEIADNGKPFDPTAQKPRQLDASLDEARIGGHGLRLMQHYLDDMHYERRDGWNRLLLAATLDDAA